MLKRLRCWSAAVDPRVEETLLSFLSGAMLSSVSSLSVRSIVVYPKVRARLNKVRLSPTILFCFYGQ